MRSQQDSFAEFHYTKTVAYAFNFAKEWHCLELASFYQRHIECQQHIELFSVDFDTLADGMDSSSRHGLVQI